ncbi:MAG: dihydrodipicolinate synthase family protein [Acidiferrobacterales bacterium]
MNKPQSFSGVLSPVLTPFNEDLSPDTERFVAHCRWLLEQGATGLAVFGTTSEANSLSVEERLELLDALIADGIAPAQLMPGTGCCALTDTVRLTRHAVSKGCAGVLLLPPFYYKGVSDDGLYANVAEVIERVGDDRLRIYLYHFPAMAVIGYSLDLIGRLIKDYPSVVIGLKDSSGDWSNTEAILERFPGFGVFPGSEVFLLQGLRAGAAGCITATANVNVSMVRNLYDRWQTPAADALQDEITALRNTIHAYPMIPALKQIIAHYRNDAAWRAVRPPLVRLSAAQARSLIADLEQKKFALAA